MKIRPYRNLGPIRNHKFKLNDFLQAVYASQMKHMASELLQYKYSDKDIEKALSTAMQICRTLGLRLEEHFLPIYSCSEAGTIKDCKLSNLAYHLTRLNANPNNPETARYQLKLFRK